MVQCQVVLVIPKTSDNWTYNRGPLKETAEKVAKIKLICRK